MPHDVHVSLVGGLICSNAICSGHTVTASMLLMMMMVVLE